MDWKIEQTGPTVHTVRWECQRKAGWSGWVLLTSDRHLDNPKSNHQMQRRHLDLAKERGALVVDCGDLFCAMQHRKDPRGMKGDTRPEHAVPDYMGAMVRSAVDFLKPYKDNLAILGVGNHELSAVKHYGLDMTQLLVDRLRDGGSGVHRGGFRGWVRFLFNERGHNHGSGIRMHYSHGAGGAAPVTKGVIQTNRRAVWLPDADLVVGGHIHESWMMTLCRNRLNDLGQEYQDEQVHLSIPTYKDEFKDQREGFHIEGERPPKPLGAWWVRFFWDRAVFRFGYEVAQAK